MLRFFFFWKFLEISLRCLWAWSKDTSLIFFNPGFAVLFSNTNLEYRRNVWFLLVFRSNLFKKEHLVNRTRGKWDGIQIFFKPDHQLCTQPFVLSLLWLVLDVCARPDKFVGGEPPGPHPEDIKFTLWFSFKWSFSHPLLSWWKTSFGSNIPAVKTFLSFGISAQY